MTYILTQVPGQINVKIAFFLELCKLFSFFDIFFNNICGSYISSAIYFSSDMATGIRFQRIRVSHAITGNRLRLLFPITLTVPPPTDYSGVMSKKRMCLGTFSRLARSLATVYIFARVRIFGTSVPFFVTGNSSEFPVTKKWQNTRFSCILPSLPYLFY